MSALNKPNLENNQSFIDKYAYYIVAFFSIGFIVAGVYRIGFLSYWIDEAFFYSRAVNFLNYGDSLFVGYDNNGVIFAVILAGVFKIFGHSDEIGRITSLIIGSTSIWLIFYLARRLFNVKTAVYSVALFSLSLFTLFLSRLCRYFTILEVTQLLLLINFLLAFEPVTQKKYWPAFFKRNNLSPIFLLLFPFTLMLALLGGQLNAFSIFGFAFYFILMYFLNIRSIGFHFFSSKYGILFLLSLFFYLILIVPFFQNKILKPVFSLLNNDTAYDLFMPNMDFIKNTFSSKEELFKVAKVYLGVPLNDYKILPYVGFAGIITAFFIDKKTGAFILSCMVLPLFLMSFIYREYIHPRYLIFLYPLILITFAGFIFFLIRKIKIILKIRKGNNLFFTILPLSLIFLAAPIKETNDVLNIKTHGRVIKKELFYGVFANWRDALNEVKNSFGNNDIILATDIGLAEHYLDDNYNIIRFRQRHYDAAKRAYVGNNYDDSTPNAYTTKALIELVKNTKSKVWLVGDFYLYNVMTDPKARQFIEQNFKYYHNITADGDITLWCYDPAQKIKPAAFVIDIGKKLSFHKLLSKPLKITLKKGFSNYKNAIITIDQEAIDFDREAVIIINGKYRIFIPPGKERTRQEVTFNIESNHFKEGGNTIQFGYSPKNKAERSQDTNQGYVVYNFKLGFR
ncbi:glycosyltransferase family 39 protein [uncultured Draconibacterium sp.]|uniref:ArnT family glycosyltransferase n=1 Tax=uncultured Draconibacterium sp. TaxID=1573823 RepID=UPI0029C8E5EB|nr:glycosyltransferase family 39 protein [uncultured Draconibacterium sp.]